LLKLVNLRGCQPVFDELLKIYPIKQEIDLSMNLTNSIIMKKNISIGLDFKGVGHGNISVFPDDDCQPFSMEAPGTRTFSLEEGDYLLRIEGVVSIAGGLVKVAENGTTLASLNLPEGYFSMPLSFTV